MDSTVKMIKVQTRLIPSLSTRLKAQVSDYSGKIPQTEPALHVNKPAVKGEQAT